MEALSQRIKNLSESQTVAMNQKTQELQAAGKDIINLTVGEPDFPTFQHIKDAGISAINNNFTYYSPVPGFPDLLKAISQKMKEDNKLDYSTNQIVVSNGAKHALANSILCLVDPGDEVIIPAPYWVSYSEIVKLSEGKSIIIQSTVENDFKVSAEEIEKAISPKTKLLILCSPSNPTGAIYSKKELQSIAEMLKKHPRVIVIADEIYEYINFIGKHESIAQFEWMKERTIIINGVSKGFAMTGWRIGYLCGPSWLAKAANKLQGQLTTGANSIAQKAATVALTSDRSPSIKMAEVFKRRRDMVVSYFKDMKDIKISEPSGAFYVFPDVSAYYNKSYGGKTIKNSMDFCLFLIEEALVATVPGEAFGNDNCIRISYATSDEKLELAMQRISEALKKIAL